MTRHGIDRIKRFSGNIGLIGGWALNMKMRLMAALAAVVFVATLEADLALAQGRGGGGPPGGARPAWQGSNPPGFGVQVNRPGWNGGSQPPGWSRAQSSPGWRGGSVPPGLAKKNR
jgi:hypothetical protein